MPRRRVYATNAERQVAYRHRQKEIGVTRPAQVASSAVPEVPSAFGHRRWRAILKQATRLVEQAADEMQSYFECRSEGWQSSERGEAFTEILDAVQDALATLGDVPY